MKLIQKISFLLVGLLILNGCEEDNGLTDVNMASPQNVDAEFSIKRDNSGEVTIIPIAEGADSFVLDFGDGSEVSEEIENGERLTHVYPEGTYDVTITAKNLAGDEAVATKNLVVSFDPPENLEVNVEISSSDPLSVSVSATADNAIGFDMTFGEVEDEEPIFVLAGEVGTYTYSSVGTFLITVEALSGGEATTVYTEEVTITDPFVLPITFESETVNYNFNNFGGGEGDGVAIVDNLNPNEINDSDKVGSYTKVSGSETWAGTSALLNKNIDFSSTTSIAVDVWSPQAGIPVLFKIEQEGNPDVFVEAMQNTTVANQWETLTFTLPEANQNDFSILALFFNFDTSGTGETYYFDNIRLTNPVLLGLPLDFEEDPASYSFTEFGGAPTEVVANPDASGINNSSSVAKTLKANGSETWAGSFIDIDIPIDLSISSTLKLKVWSPTENNQVILKLENPDTGAEAEVTQTLATANEWVEVEFDFSEADVNEEWTRIVYFFDFGIQGSGLDYYFDDLAYVTSADNDLIGTWKLAEEDGALGVGPSVGDVSWFACDAACVAERACYYDDTYVFSANGDYSNNFGTNNETWVEEWQTGSPDSCGQPVAPHDGSNPATYVFDAQNNTITLNGQGAFMGLAKAVNEGELPNVAVPSEVTYTVSFESPTEMDVYIESGSGVFWQYKLVKQ